MTGDEEKIIEIFKKSIGNDEITVKAETLKSPLTPAVMLLSEYSRRMQDMSRMYGESLSGMKPDSTIVLNLGSELVKSIPTLTEEKAKLVCEHIYDLALLGHRHLEGDEMAAFIARSVEILGIISGGTLQS